MTTARRMGGPRIVALCCRCGRAIYRGQRFSNWVEDGRTMYAHADHPHPRYRSPAEVFADRYGEKGGTQGTPDPSPNEGSKE